MAFGGTALHPLRVFEAIEAFEESLRSSSVMIVFVFRHLREFHSFGAFEAFFFEHKALLIQLEIFGSALANDR
eukprot:gene18229-18485_t